MNRSYAASLLVMMVTACSGASPVGSTGNDQNATSAPAPFAARGIFVSEDGFGTMRLDASEADILVRIPVAGAEANSAVIKGTLKTVNGKTTLTDVGQADCAVTLVGGQDSLQVTEETAACKGLETGTSFLRKYVHAKADRLKGTYVRQVDTVSSSSPRQSNLRDPATLSVTASNDDGFTFAIDVANRHSLAAKKAAMVDSADALWSAGTAAGCTMGFIVLSPTQILVESDECVDEQGVTRNYFGNYTRPAAK